MQAICCLGTLGTDDLACMLNIFPYKLKEERGSPSVRTEGERTENGPRPPSRSGSSSSRSTPKSSKDVS